MSDCESRMTDPCAQEVLESTGEAQFKPAEIICPPKPPVVPCPVLDICLPFGGRLFHSEQGCLTYEPGTPPPDGVYSKIVIADGCIQEAHVADIPIYTPTPCAPVPTPCDEEGGGAIDPSPTLGNLYTLDASGRPLVRLTVQNGAGISIAGNGTASSPLVITNTQQSSGQTWVQSGNSAIQVTGTGANNAPYRVAHVTRLQGTFAGFTFDEFGHLISHTASQSSLYVTGVVEGDGISVNLNPSTGVAVVSLADPTNIITGTFRIGGYDMEFFRNRLVRMQQVINFPAGAYRFMGEGVYHNINVNELGSLTGITTTVLPSEDPTLVRAAASKRFVGAETIREMTFKTEKVGAFRIMYQAANVPNDTTLFINGVNIPGFRESNRFNAIAPALYAAASHTVLIQSDVGFTGEGYLDVLMTVVV